MHEFLPPCLQQLAPQQVYSRMQVLQGRLLCAVFLLGIPMDIALDRWSTSPGLPCVLTAIVAVFLLAEAIFFLLFWRCPVCGRPLGLHAYGSCPHCGANLAQGSN